MVKCIVLFGILVPEQALAFDRTLWGRRYCTKPLRGWYNNSPPELVGRAPPPRKQPKEIHPPRNLPHIATREKKV